MITVLMKTTFLRNQNSQNNNFCQDCTEFSRCLAMRRSIRQLKITGHGRRNVTSDNGTSPAFFGKKKIEKKAFKLTKSGLNILPEVHKY